MDIQISSDADNPIERELTDMRDRGLTIEPIAGDEEEKCDNSLGEALAGQESTQSSVHTGRPSGKSSGQSDLEKNWQRVFSDHPKIEYIFLFAGVAPPHSWFSPWMLCRIIWPLGLILGTVVLFDLIVSLYNNNENVLVHVVVLPSALGVGTAFGCHIWLWPRAKKIIPEVVLLPPEQLNHVVQSSMAFLSVWLIIGLAVWLWLLLSGQLSDIKVFDGIDYNTYFGWAPLVSNVPALATALLLLGIEAALANNTIQGLLQAAHGKTLTRDMYITARENIYRRSQSWQGFLGTLALVALYNTVGLSIILYFPQYDKNFDRDYRAMEDFLHGVVLGKEVALLYMFLFSVVRVNDYADAICGVLSSEVWGKPGSKEEACRRDLLLLTRVYAVTPEAAGSFWRYFTAMKCQPIAFRITGLRPTGKLLTAFVVGVVGSIAASFLRRAS